MWMMVIARHVPLIIQPVSSCLLVATLCAGEELFDYAAHTGMACRVTTTPGNGKRGGSIIRVVRNEVIGVKVPGGPIDLVLLHILQEG